MNKSQAPRSHDFDPQYLFTHPCIWTVWLVLVGEVTTQQSSDKQLSLGSHQSKRNFHLKISTLTHQEDQ